MYVISLRLVWLLELEEGRDAAQEAVQPLRLRLDWLVDVYIYIYI